VDQKGRVLAAYSVPILAVTSLRVVLRPHIGRNAAKQLVGEIVDACKILEKYGGNATPPTKC
jgi:glutamate decarboxylase